MASPGWGNVGSTAAYHLAQAGARVVGIIDREGGLLDPEGFGFEQIRTLFLNEKGNRLSAPGMLTFDAINRSVWSVGAEVFLPCAGSRLVTQTQVEQLIKAGLEVVSSGANVPFADREIFYGPICEHADSNVAAISATVATALERCHARSSARTFIARTAFENALTQLV